jgi:hypothetical protein
MSTNFFRICPDCLAGKRHFHPRDNHIAAHRWFGGIDHGTQVKFINEEIERDNNFPLVSESGEFIFVGDLKLDIGKGKKS